MKIKAILSAFALTTIAASAQADIKGPLAMFECIGFKDNHEVKESFTFDGATMKFYRDSELATGIEGRDYYTGKRIELYVEAYDSCDLRELNQ